MAARVIEPVQFKRKTRKQNISITLDPVTIDSLNELSIRACIPRAELMRYAVEYSIKHPDFISILAQL